MINDLFLVDHMLITCACVNALKVYNLEYKQNMGMSWFRQVYVGFGLQWSGYLITKQNYSAITN